VQGPNCPFVAEAAAPGGIGGRDAACVVWACDDGYHAVCRAEVPGCTEEYATDDAQANTAVGQK
jgi:hypothetical protein